MKKATKGIVRILKQKAVQRQFKNGKNTNLLPSLTNILLIL